LSGASPDADKQSGSGPTAGRRELLDRMSVLGCLQGRTMNALSELPSDLTRPLLAPEILNCFDTLADGRCTLRELRRTVLDACSGDPAAATGVMLLLEDYAHSDKLKRYDFQPLKRALQRQLQEMDPTCLLTPDQFPEDVPGGEAPASGVQHAVIDPTCTFMPDPAAEEFDEAPAIGLPREPLGPNMVLRSRYVLEEEIARGGMGTVYRALDRNRAGLPHEQQYVALKVLRDEHARSPAALHALRREFQQAQSLSHPGIVNVFDFDQHGGTYFVTMELLEGEPLSALMRRVLPHTIAHEVAMRILRELGEAIAYAHDRDVLHLDLKPGNVMVTPQGRVRVLDFGLAQTFLAEPWISDARPASPAVTPAYASCERLSGELPDVRDDIFSFACLGYELMSGRHPYDRRSALVARDEGYKPRRIRALSRHQWRALKSALAWDREDRPGSMQELLHGLALHTDAPERGAHRSSGSGRSVTGLRPATALLLIVLATAVALTWNRWPMALRENIGERLAATGTGLTQAVDAAGLWVTDRLVAPISDAGSAATTAAAPAPGAGPAIESLAPATASPSPAAALYLPPADRPPQDEADVAVRPTAGAPMDAAAAPAAAPADQTVELAPAEPVAVADAGANAAPATVAVRAADGPGRLEFSSDSVSVGESGSVARVSVRRRGGAAGKVSFSWTTVDDSAIGDEDYAPATVREVMADGQTGAILLIPIVADSVAEQTESFDVVIEDASGAELGSLTRVPVIIVDDD
jgi:hypothetical protein